MSFLGRKITRYLSYIRVMRYLRGTRGNLTYPFVKMFPEAELEKIRGEVSCCGNDRVYIPCPDSRHVIQLFEKESIPSKDELKDLIPFVKPMPGNDIRLVVHYPEDTGYRLKCAKFNDVRAPRFRIDTFILEGDGGTRVLKCAHTSEAIAHLDEIFKNREKLTGVYNSVDMCGCRRIDKDTAELEYVEGESLTSGIDAANDPLEKIVKDLGELLDIIFDYKEEPVGFIETEQFRKMFPGIHPGAGEKSYSVTNLDSDADNYKRSGDRLICFDYEWVADFPVPVRFVRYRAVYYYYIANKAALRPRLGIREFIRMFGFSDKEIKLYAAMEECFLNYAKDM